jgi:mRNA interferase RelE/StbE
MIVEYRTSFDRDIKKIKEASVKKLIKEVIEGCENAKTIADIPNCEKLVSKGKYYKLKYPKYRFGVYIENGTVEFIKFGTRENFYKDFPPF